MSMHLPLQRIGTTKLSSTTTTYICSQCRHATLLRRPKRPYTFTQLITLSDGSTYTHRTTSPQAVYRSTRDTRNAPLWNPSSEKLLNIEEDEAGRLRAFRNRFGRGWDAANTVSSDAAAAGEKPQPGKDVAQNAAMEEMEDEDDNLLDLISSFGQEDAQSKPTKK
ncbi:hypothetical protein D8B26_005502 [Coccidioides posadasii str. Silveira]|uniref:50S ribosomal protein L36 n=3 Tax=Coccidioides posadasii TaxID=199306 RepID=E9D3N7_COCPS|nr:mitochondrial 54S ribosomal protein YmL36 [Coccidioides posadasii C735 delta SOWgp]EER24276.1 hypothetical protein CPC735_056460 [Coccidioides posadasii C735 delta SOWgp]EFW18680.1 50S ribosomal protein L36 [Coccidioides posadasii str. Silveira]KMM65933.1 hypothetical protein CPAG_02274 [Coccidioides posadasii RMSCC 3488]QVM10851.1 hypothetical protein D8B26_005502 [Coccidioides posadasii str. Silveira]|eukprot:XP_003066421.1 mitochondrial 54S ribosomal protein YmL36 [Coccidioides posadasii C735 delta SOWgp]